MMTLDGAIERADQVADSYKDIAPACKCAREHRQLANWLTELKVLRTENAELWELAESRKWIARMLGEQTARVVNLQELVRDMWSYINAPVNQRNSLKERLAIYDDLADRMRDLGVEVDV